MTERKALSDNQKERTVEKCPKERLYRTIRRREQYKSDRKKGSIGQSEGENSIKVTERKALSDNQKERTAEKCPIERLYRTIRRREQSISVRKKGSIGQSEGENSRKVSERKALLDKQKVGHTEG
ncbi:hypothetical protein [Mesobacillus jeotgali]|uniref:hypothetical protein n=1 Tax=Mesobacillus jeotgali TaxID=129985 RepID=UPI0009A6E78A|nr:hypothetical protein [Mesobacillus jeotgali]